MLRHKRVQDLYDPLVPLEQQGGISAEDKKDYADFYRAYSAYQLPHEVVRDTGEGTGTERASEQQRQI